MAKKRSTYVTAVSCIAVSLAVVAGVIVTHPKANELREASAMISGKMLQVREKAHAMGVRHRIVYDPNQRTFSVYREANGGGWRRDPSDDGMILPGGVYISDTSVFKDSSIYIEADGTINFDKSPVWLRLNDGKNGLHSVRVSRAGVVQVLSSW
ncbi:MAG: hypothetical protein O7D32_00675 [bacterium]|nr:hypothetical protein [bacterium]